MFRKSLIVGTLTALTIGLVGSFIFNGKSFSSKLQVFPWESTIEVKLYDESLDTVFTFLRNKKELVVNNELSLPAFDATILTEYNLYQLTTSLNSGLSLLILLQQVNAQKTLVLVKCQLKPENITETVQIPKEVWVKGHYRRGTYVKGYYRKNGTYVRGYYRGGGWVKGYYRGGGLVEGYWRTVGTETVTRIIKRYPYDLTPELLNSSIHTILDNRYRTEGPNKEIQSQMESLKNSLTDLENAKKVGVVEEWGRGNKEKIELNQDFTLIHKKKDAYRG